MGRRKFDLTGRTFTRLHVIEEDVTLRPGKSNGIRWKCRCDCGNELTVYAGSLLAGATRSCGCIRRSVRLVTGLAAEITREEASKAVLPVADPPAAAQKKSETVRWAMPVSLGIPAHNLTAPRPKRKVTDKQEQGLLEAKQYLASRGSFKINY